MTDYKEVNALQRDLDRARSVAEFLLALVGMDWTEWEVSFLNSIIKQVDDRIASRNKEPLSTRQAEMLVELRDDSVWYESPDNFSIKALVNDCFVMQHLLSENEVDFIKHHKVAGTTKHRRREVIFLFRCARKAMAIEPHQGWKLPELDAA
jgi:hypothetical protein